MIPGLAHEFCSLKRSMIYLSHHSISTMIVAYPEAVLQATPGIGRVLRLYPRVLFGKTIYGIGWKGDVFALVMFRRFSYRKAIKIR